MGLTEFEDEVSSEDKPLILAIETATRAGSFSLTRGGIILGSLSGDEAASHSLDLIENVDRLLGEGNVKLSDIDLFAVASGPGSFTGLRIGLATAKSFAACLGRQCVGISTLAAIAFASGPSKAGTVALLPAGRGEVFAQMFSVANGIVEGLDSAAHVTPDTLLQRYGNLSSLTWAGEGAQLHSAKLREWAEAHATEWIVAVSSKELAVSVSALALREYHAGRTVNPEALRATYVRASDAEINERWQPETSTPPVLI